jgi:hypothetical protein
MYKETGTDEEVIVYIKAFTKYEFAKYCYLHFTVV